MSYPYLIQGNNIVVVIGNNSHTISNTHITYQKVLDAIKAEDWETVKDVIEPKKVVLDYGMGFVSIKGETLYWKGTEMHNALSTRMIQMLTDGFPIKPLVFFMENLMENPSYRSVTELYGFLEKNNLPITPEGHFLAYKKVRADYTDVHSGKFDNSVGQVVEMERHDVDDNKDNTCSTGLHFCSMSYLSCFGGERTVIVKINPADVVSIPSDYNDAKGRACRYEVIGELAVEAKDAFVSPVQSTAVGSQPVYQAGPKTGDTVFKRGYTEGYTGVEYGNAYRYGTKEATDYTEGYEMGEKDARNGDSERYRYVPATKVQVANGAWPFPKS